MPADVALSIAKNAMNLLSSKFCLKMMGMYQAVNSNFFCLQ